MFLYQGIREKIKEDVSAGMDYCPHCRIFTRFFLGRHLRIKHLNYIPLKTWVLDYAEFCEKCRCGRVLTEDTYKKRMRILEPLSKRKMQMQCYKTAISLSSGRAASPESAAAVMDALAAEFPVRSSPQLEEIYRRRVEMLLVLNGRGGDPQALMHRAAVQPVQAIMAEENE